MWWAVFVALAQEPVQANSRFEHLPEPAVVGPRATLQAAAWELVDGPSIELAGRAVTAERVAAWAAWTGDDLEQHVASELGRAVDLTELLRFLDDVVRREGEVVLTGGRARGRGVLVHPAEAFDGEVRAWDRGRVAVDRPRAQRLLVPALDGDPLGPRWTTRFANPPTPAAQLLALQAERPEGDFPERIALLLAELEAQGAEVYLTSGARDPRRGYLLWGSFLMSRQTTSAGVERTAVRLERAAMDWELDVPIRWRHPDGWRATVAAARAMAETYDVVYATERGARESNHYGGEAVDLVGLDLPATVVLSAPDGATERFDLRDRTRDLSVEPTLVAWVEEHFAWRKLRRDYPHWGDAAAD